LITIIIIIYRVAKPDRKGTARASNFIAYLAAHAASYSNLN